MSTPPEISVLIPTLNEARWIGHAVRAAHASASSAGVRVEIIVCDAGSTDDTLGCARRAGADVVVEVGRAGRAHQINEGLRRARGAWVAFLHADSLLTPDAFEAIRGAAQRGCDGGWFEVQIVAERADILTANLLGWVARGINLRTRLFRTATADQCIFARRDVVDVLGGMPAVRLFEGNRFARAMRGLGRVAVLGPHVRISGRRWERHGLCRVLTLMYALRVMERCGVPTQRLHRLWTRTST